MYLEIQESIMRGPDESASFYKRLIDINRSNIEKSVYKFSKWIY